MEEAAGEKLYVNEKGDEYVEVAPETGEKIRMLLESQKDIGAHHDLHALFASADQIAGANCHKTALFLTGRYTKDQLFSPDNDRPETAGHADIEAGSVLYKNLNKFHNALAEKEFPYRVSFFKRNERGEFEPRQSVTVLGLSNKGRVVGFEKGGPYGDTVFRYVNALHSISFHLKRGYAAALEKEAAGSE